MSHRAQIEAAMQRGDFIEAFNIADAALASNPEDAWLAYAAVLALARSGATRLARRRYDTALATLVNKADGQLRVDILALDGRLRKDEARSLTGESRRAAYRAASRAYAKAFDETQNSFPGINAATLAFLAGDRDDALLLAQRTEAALHGERSDDYFHHATLAELHLLRADIIAAAAEIEILARFPFDAAKRSATRRQLRDLCAAAGIDLSVLLPLANPPVIHYTGHITSTEQAAHAIDALNAALSQIGPASAYGSLAAGADILVAEAMLARGASLNVVLPFARDEFRTVSVTAWGEDWGERFDRVLEKASAVYYASDGEYLGDDTLFTYAAIVAMGLARLEAQRLDTNVTQIALVDRSSGASLTSADMQAWKETGGEIVAVQLARPTRAAAVPQSGSQRRVVRAMLFGDVHGFSKLRESQHETFVAQVLGRFAAVLDRYRHAIQDRNTWGDGLYVVFDDPIAAARCALDLQNEIAQTEFGLRLGVHYGPVFPIHDPVRNTQGFFGAQVSKTARIEPITPEGSVYVTEPFAAAIALHAPDDFRCEYVGRVPAAKGYGHLRIYALTDAM